MVDVGAASLQNIGNPPREEHGCGTLQILYNTVHGYRLRSAFDTPSSQPVLIDWEADAGSARLPRRLPVKCLT